MRNLYIIIDGMLNRLLKPLADALRYPHYPEAQYAGSEHPCPRCGLVQKTVSTPVPVRSEPHNN